MLNYRSPIVNSQLVNPYIYGQPNNIAVGYNGYNNMMQQNYYNMYGMDPRLNPYLLAEQRKKEEEEAKKRLQTELNVMKNLYKFAKKYKNEDYDEEAVDKFYSLETYTNPVQKKPEKKKDFKVVVVTTGDKVVESKPRKENNDISYFGMISKQNDDRLMDKIAHDVVNGTLQPPQYQIEYQQKLERIKKEHDNAVNPDSDLVDFLDNAYKLYIEALQHKALKQQRQLNTLYNKDEFTKTLYRNEQMRYASVMNANYNLDDDEIHLPPGLSLQNNYNERKRKFLEAAMRRN